MDREKKIAEIREALEKATQGPWKWIDPGGLERKKLVGEWEIMNFGIGGVYDQVAGSEPDEDDAHLIANAPEWLRFLLSELDRIQQEYAEERSAHNAHVAELCELGKENRKLLEERDEARRKAEEAWKEIDSLEEQLLSSQQEIERLRQLYEREREIADQALEQVKNLREERNQDRQWIEKASENVTQLQQERDKMIEWLRTCLFNHGCWREEDYVAYMRNILKEVGVTVE